MGIYTISNDTFALSWWFVLLVEETAVFSENNQSQEMYKYCHILSFRV